MSRSPSGIFLGETAIDGVERMHAFHHVQNRDMAVVVAANWSEVMGVANDLAAGALRARFRRVGAGSGDRGIVLWELYTIRSNRRQKRVFDRNRSELERLRTEEGVLVARAQLNAARLKMVVDSTADGIALFDFNLKLVQWNHPFHRGIGDRTQTGYAARWGAASPGRATACSGPTPISRRKSAAGLGFAKRRHIGPAAAGAGQ